MRKKHIKQEKMAQPDLFLVSVLMNSVFYFIENALIVSNNGRFRLLVIHQGVLLTDEYYGSVKGAKIAFRKFWGYKAWKADVQSEWSHFYPPDGQWLDEKMNEPEPLSGNEKKKINFRISRIPATAPRHSRL